MTMIRLPLPFALAALSLSGCAFQDNLESGTDDPCATLQNIVADYPTGFSDFRKGGSNFRSLTIYRAKEELIRGHCEVWAWGNGDSAYVCTAGAPDLDVASWRYNQAVAKVSECLGPEWVSEEKPREKDGEAVGVASVFQHEGKRSPVVSVHRVEDRSSQSVYLYIGSSGRKL
ncbi:MAG: hypothetical protein ABR522_02820 [Marinobacter sp.]